MITLENVYLDVYIPYILKILRIVFIIRTKGKNEFRNKFFTNFETVCQVEQLNRQTVEHARQIFGEEWFANEILHLRH